MAKSKRIKLKINNETKYPKDMLRKLILRAIKEYAGADWRSWKVDVVYSRSGCLTGYAYYDSGRMRLRVGRGSFSVKGFFQLAEHEIAHCYGIKHEDMARDVMYCTQEIPYASEYPTHVHEVQPRGRAKAKPGKTLQETRAEHAAKKLAEHERKLKRQANLVKKWKAKVSYYDRALSKKAAGKKDPEA